MGPHTSMASASYPFQVRWFYPLLGSPRWPTFKRAKDHAQVSQRQIWKNRLSPHEILYQQPIFAINYYKLKGSHMLGSIEGIPCVPESMGLWPRSAAKSNRPCVAPPQKTMGRFMISPTGWVNRVIHLPCGTILVFCKSWTQKKGATWKITNRKYSANNSF